MAFATSTMLAAAAVASAVTAGVSMYSASQMEGPPKPKTHKESPVATPERADAADLRKTRRRRSGRANTIVTGDLEPVNVGRKTLLG